MKKLQVKSYMTKFSLLVFFAINIIVIMTENYYATVMNRINFYIADFGNRTGIIWALCLFAVELILVILLFIKKSKFKLISNIVLEILCVADICLCISSIANNMYAFESKIGIILDLIFIALITLDIVITYKKPIQNTNTDTEAQN